MAKDTSIDLRNSNIYSVFIRNYSEEGTFQSIQNDLKRIKNLGTDIIWFLPFYPIGEIKRKGSVGSPYAIKDYRGLDTTHGTLEDFKQLVEEIHALDMTVMMDIVFNHTSPDSVLVEEHPEWFFKKSNGEMGNQVGEWTDIVDLDYSNKALWDYQIDTITQWAELVDGFRCDVAPLVPVAFWEKARAAVSEIKPDFIWLAESIERHFLQYLRTENVLAHSDGEMYQAFDMSYDYDVYPAFKEYVLDEAPLSKYIYALNLQDSNYPDNYIKVKFLENHDQDRIAALIRDIDDLKQWNAFNYLQKGANLIYNGQEVLADKVPSLFEKDTIDWEASHDLSTYMSHLANLKKKFIPTDNVPYSLVAHDELNTVTLSHSTKTNKIIGVFNLKKQTGVVAVDLPDGEYTNYITNEKVNIADGQLSLADTPALLITE